MTIVTIAQTVALGWHETTASIFKTGDAIKFNQLPH